MNWQRLRSRILEEFSPDGEEMEELRRTQELVSDYITSEFGLETHFAGSASRSTCLAGDSDIDLFVLFPPEKSDEELEQKGLEIGRSVFREFGGEFKVEYAEHPYTKGELDGKEVEIVPCFDVDPEEIRSSVDRTPHHSRWVRENLDEQQREDVVILKAFLRARGIYGSSLKTRGFSGYLCEILVAEYGGFRSLMEEVPDWEQNEVLDPEGHHGGEIPERLEERFEQDSLVVIDPVDPERNVAAVLSEENYAEFVYSMWEFSRSPGLSRFESASGDFTEFELEREIDSRADFIVIEFDRPDGVDDVVYPQMEKTLRSFRRVLESSGFRIFESGFHVDERTRIFFELDASLPEVEYVEGPEVFHNEEHLEQFREKYSKVFVRGSRLCAKSVRQFTEARELVKSKLERPKEIGVPDRVARRMSGAVVTDPLAEDSGWLKYLAEELKV
ncbi:MAG: CCA tRNA nucleotidyltransferase [Candidatus Nanohaloarchaea archaeon]